MRNLTFLEIRERIEGLSLPTFDLIIGIAGGGIVPAGLIAYKTCTDMRIIKINHRDENNNPRYKNPVLLSAIEENFNELNILIVDDVSVTGKTLDLAKSFFTGNKIKTMVFKGKADYILFPEIETCVKWPWK